MGRMLKQMFLVYGSNFSWIFLFNIIKVCAGLTVVLLAPLAIAQVKFAARKIVEYERKGEEDSESTDFDDFRTRMYSREVSRINSGDDAYNDSESLGDELNDFIHPLSYEVDNIQLV